jgi:hypothetical protein
VVWSGAAFGVGCTVGFGVGWDTGAGVAGPGLEAGVDAGGVTGAKATHICFLLSAVHFETCTTVPTFVLPSVRSRQTLEPLSRIFVPAKDHFWSR